MNTFDLIAKEKDRQDKTIELIASENFVSENVMKAVGSCFTNKYAEGYPAKRYYGGCDVVDELENYCKEQWGKVFNTDYHINVQPHSGSQANMAAIMSVCNPKDRILSMSLNDGGHLTHGSPVSFSGKLYDIINYNVNDNGWIDYEDIRFKILLYMPKLVIIGASAYPREINFERIYNIINDCANEAYRPIYMVDMAHIAGLVATGEHNSPFGYADIITTTTHKTLRGTRGGLIFCKPEFAKKIDSAVFPCCQGGGLFHIIAGKAVTAEEAQTEEYKEYIKRVVANAKAMANEFTKLGMDVVTGGTDNHLLLLDLSKTHPNVTGKMAQNELDKNGITLNKNMIHNDKRKPNEASGLRIGTPAMTTKGWGEEEFRATAVKIKEILDKLNKEDTSFDYDFVPDDKEN